MGDPAKRNSSLLITALVLFIIFLLSELAARTYDLYYYFPNVDNIIHFFAGLSIGVGAYWVLLSTILRKKKFLAVYLTYIVALLWELLEMLEDKLFSNPPWLVDPFFWDGITDVFFTVLGGCAGIILLLFLKKRTRLLAECRL